MRLIVDSGSTKADWVLCKEDEIVSSFNTIGFNPYFMSSSDVVAYLNQRQDLSEIASSIGEIYFYGAGCSDPQMNNIIHSALSDFFQNAQVTVDHDLHAAAFSLYSGNPVVACILGTGSNSCFYDGYSFREEAPALGFILGDEASGSFFGKCFIRDYQYKRMPLDLREDFEAHYETRWSEIVAQVYQSSKANVRLASYFPFAVNHASHPYILNLMELGFNLFLDYHVLCYPEARAGQAEVSCIGSVGYHFKALLSQLIQEKGLRVGKIIQKPIQSLVLHHSNMKKNAIHE